MPDHQLTLSLSWSLLVLRKAWNAAKAEEAPWWARPPGCRMDGGVVEDVPTMLTVTR